METYSIELTGTTTWNPLAQREARFTRFILRADGFFFEFAYERSHYSGIFQRKQEDYFSGTFEARGDGGRRSGSGTCRLGQSGDGFELRGEWYEKEEGESVERHYPDWYAELYRP